MSALREIKGHIRSVSSIAKVTRALEVVSSARSHRLQLRVDRTRPFAERAWEILSHLASATGTHLQEDSMFLGRPGTDHIGMLLITSNRGLAGAYDQNVIALATNYIERHGGAVELIAVGKVGRDAMMHLGHSIHADFGLSDSRADIRDVAPVAQVILDGFRNRVFDQVVLAYTVSERGSGPQPSIRQLLPVSVASSADRREYIYEPNARDLLVSLLPRVIRLQIYQAFLESLVAENRARVVAMHSATHNATELIEHLGLTYNKARQQSITEEVMDILRGSASFDGM